MATKAEEEAEQQRLAGKDANRPAALAATAQQIRDTGALSWLGATDEDLVKQRESLGFRAPDGEPDKAYLKDLREKADDYARSQAGDVFVDDWIKKNR